MPPNSNRAVFAALLLLVCGRTSAQESLPLNGALPEMAKAGAVPAGQAVAMKEVRAQWASGACLRAASGVISPVYSRRPAERVMVSKSLRTLALCSKGQVLAHYRIALGFRPEGKKMWLYDGRTPEGVYHITEKSAKMFHRALRLSYPNEEDKARAKGRFDPGGGILIHGLSESKAHLGSRHAEKDWTNGCIAVDNTEIEEIWELVPEGTPVEIEP
ncbi:MAG: L,D-transpeptidase family protein [Elusimicrobiota bacterium]|jgi:murein L,D-transpeptidase YafK